MVRRSAITAASFALALFLTLPGVSRAWAPQVAPAPAGQEIDGTFDVGEGRMMYLHCAGAGSPTVILESGALDDHAVWDAVSAGIAGTTRVCAHDRAGIGQSDPPPDPWNRTIEDAADDLHALLAAAGVQGPFVLAGHSLGGMIVRLYAAQYPDEVAGLIIVDGTPAGFVPAVHLALPDLDLFGEDQPDDTPAEHFDLLQSDVILAASVLPPFAPVQVPAIVLTHGIPFAGLHDVPGPMVDAIEELWYQFQEVQADVLDGELIVAEDAGHAIHRERPDLVIDAILEVVSVVHDPPTQADPDPHS
jgi:pimeloyl-ACP methyl ester carboxylesterase